MLNIPEKSIKLSIILTTVIPDVLEPVYEGVDFIPDYTICDDIVYEDWTVLRKRSGSGLSTPLIFRWLFLFPLMLLVYFYFKSAVLTANTWQPARFARRYENWSWRLWRKSKLLSVKGNRGKMEIIYSEILINDNINDNLFFIQ